MMNCIMNYEVGIMKWEFTICHRGLHRNGLHRR